MLDKRFIVFQNQNPMIAALDKGIFTAIFSQTAGNITAVKAFRKVDIDLVTIINDFLSRNSYELEVTVNSVGEEQDPRFL